MGEPSKDLGDAKTIIATKIQLMLLSSENEAARQHLAYRS
jgi:hypothetical protein